MGLLDGFFGRNPKHVANNGQPARDSGSAAATMAAAEIRALLQRFSDRKAGDLLTFTGQFASRMLKIGEPAVDRLIAQFDDASGNPRFIIAQTLAAMSAQDFGTDTNTRIRDWLITALQDKEGAVRDSVAAHICVCRDAAVLEPLVRCALGDPDSRTRDIARDSALGFIADLHRVPEEARGDFEDIFQQLRAACADFPEDDITRAVEALACTTSATDKPVSVESGKTARTTAAPAKGQTGTSSASGVCKAFQAGRCVVQGADTGPCDWDPSNWRTCNVVIENMKHGGW